jgi:hypothetical protein
MASKLREGLLQPTVEAPTMLTTNDIAAQRDGVAVVLPMRRKARRRA